MKPDDDTPIMHLDRANARVTAFSEYTTRKLAGRNNRGKSFGFRNRFTPWLPKATKHLQLEFVEVIGTSFGRNNRDNKEFSYELGMLEGGDDRFNKGNMIKRLPTIVIGNCLHL